MSSAPQPSSQGQLDQKLRATLNIHAARLQHPQIGFEVWSGLLSEKERCQVGAFQDAFTRGTGWTIGMWARAKGTSRALATLQLARLYGMPEGQYAALVRQVDAAQPISDLLSDRNRLYWDSERGELHWHGEIVRTIRNQQTGHELVQILDAFEECGWPVRIDDPLPSSSNPTQLADRIKSLNKGLQRIRFRKSGEGVAWRPLS